MRYHIYTALLVGALVSTPSAIAQTISIAMIKAATETTSDKLVSCAFDDLRGRLLREKAPESGCYLAAFGGLQHVTRQYVVERKESPDQACSRRLSGALDDIERQLLDTLNSSSGRGRIDGLRKVAERLRGEFRDVVVLCEKTEDQSPSRGATGATGSRR